MNIDIIVNVYFNILIGSLILKVRKIKYLALMFILVSFFTLDKSLFLAFTKFVYFLTY